MNKQRKLLCIAVVANVIWWLLFKCQPDATGAALRCRWKRCGLVGEAVLRKAAPRGCSDTALINVCVSERRPLLAENNTTILPLHTHEAEDTYVRSI